MRRVHHWSWMVGLSIATISLTTAAAKADSSFSDITGTNIWNNTAPVFETDGTLDPDFIARVNQLNQEAEQAFQSCNAAIAQAEQNVPTTRRYARQPGSDTVAVPVACRQLEELRAEAESLRAIVEEATSSRSNPAFLTW
ncbi:MAG TPA: hypothetical protein DDZ80_18010 [Cyanobacteria bacterium UBA8803]|nr:hypothetical protein [Cyanobacteria bacterium UBA9273]HBL60281.1 hypothetical protein [Cyanobacteria bacterium UBA8803]